MKTKLAMGLLVLVPFCAIASDATGLSPEQAEVVDVIRAFHGAMAAADARGAAERLSPTYFIADERSLDGRTEVRAHLFLSGEKLRSWPQSYLEEVGPYANSFETQSVSLRGDAAVVLTRDTGSNAFRAWKNEETVWYLGRHDGEWRIIGTVIRNIQLPE